MYAASDTFHKAVAEGNEQKALLIFSDCVFTDDDIDVETGIDFTDYFNTNEDLSIGQATSNEIKFSLFNDDGLLNSYKFGEFQALLGVYYKSANYVQRDAVTIVAGNDTYTGHDTYPYMRKNGVAMKAQPSWAVKAILVYNGLVWAFRNTGEAVVYNAQTGANVTSSKNKPNAFMRAKAKTWEGKGIYYNISNHILKVSQAGVTNWYEFVPLGTFIAERPKSPDQIIINMDCFDLMQKFDVDMPTSKKLGITYPATISKLLQQMCKYLDVSVSAGDFINKSARMAEEPEEFEKSSMRDVLKWIAEAACANARFDRDGILRLAWLKTTSQKYDMSAYETFSPYWYATKKVTKLYNRNTSTSIDATKGSGSENYLIQDNPLLKGVT